MLGAVIDEVGAAYETEGESAIDVTVMAEDEQEMRR
jgi:hypothetical protein